MSAGRFIEGAEGDIYNKKGVHIGNDGKQDQKVYLLDTNSDKQLSQQQSLDMTTSVSNLQRINACVNVCFDGAEMSEVPITNDELNLRLTLTTLSQAELALLSITANILSMSNHKKQRAV